MYLQYKNKMSDIYPILIKSSFVRLTDFFGINLIFCREPCWSLECHPFWSSWCGDEWPSVRTSVDICDDWRLYLFLSYRDSLSHDISQTKVSWLACQLLELPLQRYGYIVIRVSVCCLSCSALKLIVLDCDWTKCPQRHANGMIGEHKWPQSVSVWVSIDWQTTTFRLQTSDRKKVHLEMYKHSDLLYTLELLKK